VPVYEKRLVIHGIRRPSTLRLLQSGTGCFERQTVSANGGLAAARESAAERTITQLANHVVS